MKKRIFINQQNLESSLSEGRIILEGSILRANDFSGYYRLTPAIKFTACISNPADPLEYVGKCSALSIFEKQGIEIHMHSIDYRGETYEVDEGFLGDYYHENETDDEVESTSSPAATVAYDPNLIKKLNNDHEKLLELFTEIMEAASDNNFDTVNQKLNVFDNRLQLHLMTEQIKFHTYLEQALKNCAMTQQMNKNFQDRIKVIGQTALDFIDQYRESSWEEETKKEFVEGLEGLGKILTERIDMEEELYELYLPKSAYLGAV